MIRIRLMALPEDNTAALARLEDSGDRVLRGTSKLRFRYLTVRIRP